MHQLKYYSFTDHLSLQMVDILWWTTSSSMFRNSVKMSLPFAASLVCCCIVLVSCTVKKSSFKLIDVGLQFGTHGKILETHVKSDTHCAALCATVSCNSFSFSNGRICTLSHLHVKEKKGDQSSIFIDEEGTQIFTYTGKIWL